MWKPPFIIMQNKYNIELLHKIDQQFFVYGGQYEEAVGKHWREMPPHCIKGKMTFGYHTPKTNGNTIDLVQQVKQLTKEIIIRIIWSKVVMQKCISFYPQNDLRNVTVRNVFQIAYSNYDLFFLRRL